MGANFRGHNQRASGRDVRLFKAKWKLGVYGGLQRLYLGGFMGAPCHGDCSTDQALSRKDAKANLGPKETELQIVGSGADSLGTTFLEG